MLQLVRLAARLVGRPAASRSQAQLSLPFSAPRLGLVETSFASPAGGRGRHAGSAVRSHRFWIRQDPQDGRRAAIGGSFAEVCAVLECLAAQESFTAQ